MINTGIGIILTETGGGVGEPTTSTLQALAGGTILYVIMFEILSTERTKQDVNGLLQFIGLLIGFVSMMLVEIFSKFLLICKNLKQYFLVHHEHEHEEGGEKYFIM